MLDAAGSSTHASFANHGTTPKKDDEDDDIKPVSLMKMYRFATPLDVVVLTIGIISALSGGAVMSAFAILLGRSSNQVNSAAGIPFETLSYFIIVGVVTLVVCTLQVVCFTYVGDRSAVKFRASYLQSMLAQDMSFFDTHKAGELSTAVAESAVVYREAVGDKLAQIIQCGSQFVVGIIVGFAYSWKLSLVVMCLMPIIGISGYICMKQVHARTAGEQKAYAKAGSVAEETISNVRTVTSFNAQDNRVSIFNKAVVAAADFYRRQNVITSTTTGVVMMSKSFILPPPQFLSFSHEN